MKHLFLILSLLFVSVSAGPSFDDNLRELIEYVKQQMRCGFPSLGVPPLAPYTKDYTAFDLTNHGLDLKGNLSDLSVEGLNDFEVKELTFASILMKLQFDLTFKEIKIFSQYIAKGGMNVFGLPFLLSGNGDLDLVLENLRFNGSCRIRPTSSNGLQIWAFKSNLLLEGAQSKITGIMNSQILTKFFNQWVEEFLRIFFEDYQSEINAGIESLVVPAGNVFLKDVSMTQLVALVFGFGNTENLPICEL